MKDALKHGMTEELQPPPLPRGEQWALFLDVDGTLVGFMDDPARVTLAPTLPALLQRLASRLGGALGVLSGRCLAEIDTLFAPMRLPAGALHGHELRDPEGRLSVLAPEPGAAHRIADEARQTIDALPGVTLESKRGIGFALHYRLAPEHAAAVVQAAESIAGSSAGAYEVQHGDCVAELKPAGADKGSALRRLMAQPPFRGRRPVVVGDDLTDETAFAVAARMDGFGVIVGARRPTRASYGLEDPASVQEWLRRMSEEDPS